MRCVRYSEVPTERCAPWLLSNVHIFGEKQKGCTCVGTTPGRVPQQSQREVEQLRVGSMTAPRLLERFFKRTRYGFSPLVDHQLLDSFDDASIP